MVFRIDDLLVSVLPAGAAERPGCEDASKIDHVTPSPCSDISEQCNCGHPYCLVAGSLEKQPKQDTPTPRDEQLAFLSRELERALAR